MKAKTWMIATVLLLAGEQAMRCLVHGIQSCRCDILVVYERDLPQKGEEFSIGFYRCPECNFRLSGTPQGTDNGHHPGCPGVAVFETQYRAKAV